MSFKKVYKQADIDGKNCFVPSPDMTWENYVIYFARKSVYGFNGDSPVMGVGFDYLKCSEVEGPYTVPVQEKSSFEGIDEHRIEQIRLILNEVPSFVPVELWSVGLHMEADSESEQARMVNISNQATDTLKKHITNVQQLDNDSFTGEYFGQKVGLHNQTYRGFSSVEFKMFGRPFSAEQTFIVNELDVVRALESRGSNHLDFFSKMTELRQKGLAYNLDLSAIKDVRQVSELENIIL
ncbi:MAG: hypothetical protein HY363_05845 [Candidatus Aenigmarchaeota archaeon]|nr:hypothetical protein [Candidatus Aenigmarchaeota archaeon]